MRFLVHTTLFLLITCACLYGQVTPIDSIQFTTDSLGNSPLIGDTLITGGIVTGANFESQPILYFISDREGGLWSGVLVHDYQNRALSAGDSVRFRARVRELSSQTRLDIVVPDSFSMVPASGSVPPLVVQTGSVGESAEGVLVEARNATVTAVGSNYFYVNDGSDSMLVAEGWTFSYCVEVGDTLAYVRGLVSYESSHFRVNPRTLSDLGLTSGTAPCISNVGHTPSSPSELQNVTVTATIVDDQTVDSARVLYRFGSSGDFLTVPMRDDGVHGDGAAGDGVWGGIIPPALGWGDSTVYYYVSATDNELQTRIYPRHAPDSTLSYRITPARHAVPIDSLYSDFDAFYGDSVLLRGVITHRQDYVTTTGSPRINAYIQDGSGRGFYLSQSRSASTYPGIRRGNLIEVKGIITTYDGVTQMGSFTSSTISVLAENQPLPEPYILRTGDRTHQREIVEVHTTRPDTLGAGTWVQVTGTIYKVDENVGGGTNIYIDDGTGSTVIRIWDSFGLDTVYLDNSPYRMRDLVGVTLTFQGAASTYKGDFQMLGGYAEDFFTAPPGEPSPSLVLDVPNRPFAPDIGQTLRISYNVPALCQVRLRVYNLRGQLMCTIVDKPAGGPNVIIWDGRNELRELLPLGTYILHLEAVRNGSSDTVIKPVVIGTKL